MNFRLYILYTLKVLANTLVMGVWAENDGLLGMGARTSAIKLALAGT